MGLLERLICPRYRERIDPIDHQTFYAELDARPRLRGWLHLVAAFAAAIGLIALVANAHSTEARIGAWTYGIASIALYATSSSYHIFARSPRVRTIMQRADHSMIYVLIAGTFTPVALLNLDDPLRTISLVMMWSGAVTGVLLKTVWFSRASKVATAMYLVLGWAGLLAFPALTSHPRALLLIATGGILYTVGAVLFFTRRPRWTSTWFGYHELWHSFGIAAGALIFIANLGLIRAA